MKLKESEYEERRSQVKKFCVEHQQQFSNGTRRMNLIYNGRDRIAYCAIPKVASSTWCWHFIQLGEEDFYNFLFYFLFLYLQKVNLLRWVNLRRDHRIDLHNLGPGVRCSMENEVPHEGFHRFPRSPPVDWFLLHMSFHQS